MLQVAQLTILHELPINALAESLGVPETTLRELYSEIRELLADNLELVRQLQELLDDNTLSSPEALRVMFVDEGFLKIAGKVVYLIFALSRTGEPLDVQLVPERNATALWECLEQARVLLGGVDVIVSDGGKAIHAAMKQLDQPIIHVQQIHADTGKHIFIHDLTPLDDCKRIRDFVIELHANTLKTET